MADGWQPTTWKREIDGRSEQDDINSMKAILNSDAAKNTPTGTLSIPAALVPSGAKLEFRVKLTNFLGEFQTTGDPPFTDDNPLGTALKVQKEGRPLPMVRIEGPPVLVRTRADGLMLIGEASVAIVGEVQRACTGPNAHV